MQTHCHRCLRSSRAFASYSPESIHLEYEPFRISKGWKTTTTRVLSVLQLEGCEPSREPCPLSQGGRAAAQLHNKPIPRRPLHPPFSCYIAHPPHVLPQQTQWQRRSSRTHTNPHTHPYAALDSQSPLHLPPSPPPFSLLFPWDHRTAAMGCSTIVAAVA